ncbi:MAG TPA: 2Fe-2S iron-sulfur cluster-binding protein, partial [Clostridiales bacterium]|nr:2Fe-2S iron-sulfur cluster-binding protein [Clostridiales bacterium]
MTLTILKDGVPQTLAAAKGENLLNILRTQGYDINSVCSGNGSCGKCKVHFLTTPPPLSRVEQRMLSPQEISEGMRLACRVALEGDCTVEIPSDSGMAIAGAGVEKRENGDGRCFAAVDIGTTTLVAALVDASGSVLATKGEKNRQAAFGADVISRVKHIHTGGLGELQRTVAAQIDSMLLGLLKEFPAARLESTTVSGNTAMLNIFFNEDCSGLGFAPYTPAFLSSRRASAASLGLSVGGDVVSVAGMASFAGGDITAGIVALPAQDDGLASNDPAVKGALQ